MRKNQKGFTLIELLVVIGIIVLLSTLAVFSLNSARQKSRDAKRLADVKQMQTALELFYDDAKAYPEQTVEIVGPTESSPMCLRGKKNDDTGFTFDCAETDITIYMGFVPGDPGTYSYSYSSSDGKDYKLKFKLEASTAGLPANKDICASSTGFSICVE